MIMIMKMEMYLKDNNSNNIGLHKRKGGEAGQEIHTTTIDITITIHVEIPSQDTQLPQDQQNGEEVEVERLQKLVLLQLQLLLEPKIHSSKNC